MNHLAHALIADRTGTSIVGNLMGDFVKGRPEDRYDGEILGGLRLHRRVDAITDDHPVFHRSRERLRPPFRRFGGILVDVFYDHFLARHWASFADTELRAFVDDVYAALAASRAVLPARMHRFVDYMTATDLLASYETRDGVARALAGVSGRVRRPNPLDRAREALDGSYLSLDSDFSEFFPDLLARLAQPDDRQ